MVYLYVWQGALEQVIGMGDVGPLTDVLHVPNLVFDLVSEPMLARQDMQGAWADDWKTIRTREGRLFLVAHLNAHNLYEVNPMYLGLRNSAYNYECYEANASKVEAVDLLHRTWGHILLDLYLPCQFCCLCVPVLLTFRMRS